MAMTRIDLIDGALLRIGAEPVMSESVPEALANIAIFDSIVGFCLSAAPWGWNTVTRRLVRLSDPPQRYWKHQFELPGDMLGTPRAAYDSASCERPFTRWELMDGRLMSEAADVWLEMDKRSEPAAWPGYFVELIQVAMMAELALSIREDRGLYERLHEKAFGTPSEMRQGGLMGIALGIDAQSKPSYTLNIGANPLASARYER
jgi:hypothetical protein